MFKKNPAIFKKKLKIETQLKKYLSQCSINGTSVLHANNFLHIPGWQEGILGVPVDGEGYISVGLK